MSRTLTVAWGSLAVSAVVLGLKFAAYWLTGSVALYSDALETIIHVVAAAGALVAVWVSGQTCRCPRHHLQCGRGRGSPGCVLFQWATLPMPTTRTGIIRPST